MSFRLGGVRWYYWPIVLGALIVVIEVAPGIGTLQLECRWVDGTPRCEKRHHLFHGALTLFKSSVGRLHQVNLWRWPSKERAELKLLTDDGELVFPIDPSAGEKLEREARLFILEDTGEPLALSVGGEGAFRLLLLMIPFIAAVTDFRRRFRRLSVAFDHERGLISVRKTLLGFGGPARTISFNPGDRFEVDTLSFPLNEAKGLPWMGSPHQSCRLLLVRPDDSVAHICTSTPAQEAETRRVASALNSMLKQHMAM